jgi:hypothetical protein
MAKSIANLEAIIARLEGDLAALVDRLNALEVKLDDGDTAGVKAGSDQDRRLSKSQLAERWGICARSISRAQLNPGFVEGELSTSGRWYFWLSKIQQYEQIALRGNLLGASPTKLKGYDPSRFLPRNQRPAT